MYICIKACRRKIKMIIYMNLRRKKIYIYICATKYANVIYVLLTYSKMKERDSRIHKRISKRI